MRRLPSGENARPLPAKFVSTVVVLVSVRPSKLQICTRPSSPPVATSWPLGDIATALTCVFGQPLLDACANVRRGATAGWPAVPPFPAFPPFPPAPPPRPAAPPPLPPRPPVPAAPPPLPATLLPPAPA